MDSFLPFLRGLWLAVALLFALRDLTSETMVVRLFDGSPRSPQQWIAGADAAVAMFPLDQHLRNLRAWIVEEAHKKERHAVGR